MITSHSQLHHGRSAAAFVLWWFGYRLYVRVLLQGLAQGFAEDAHAAAVDNAHAGQSGEESVVDEFFHFAGGVVDVAADDVDFDGAFWPFSFRARRKFRGRGRPLPGNRPRAR